MQRLKAWIELSRPPFHTVGIFPFLLGGIISKHLKSVLNLPILLWGTLAVIFIMLATYYSGEYFDYETDTLSAKLERNKFSGGTQVLQTGIIPRKHALIASYISLIIAGIIGLLLFFYYKTGVYTIPLGIIGIVGGFFYSTKPVQWAYRGIGETWIAFCYGWLPVAVSCYLQTGHISPLVHWVSIPIALTIFNVILINEFPDYPADKIIGKKNLVVRFGRERMAYLYIVMTIGTWIFYFLSVKAGVPKKALFFFLPFFLLSFNLTVEMIKKDYKNRKKLEKICAKTLIFNLGTTLSYIIGFILG
jgi:1,4-dihydroxy-2-naphthoate octaprenyltransferase